MLFTYYPYWIKLSLLCVCVLDALLWLIRIISYFRVLISSNLFSETDQHSTEPYKLQKLLEFNCARRRGTQLRLDFVSLALICKFIAQKVQLPICICMSWCLCIKNSAFQYVVVVWLSALWCYGKKMCAGKLRRYFLSWWLYFLDFVGEPTMMKEKNLYEISDFSVFMTKLGCSSTHTYIEWRMRRMNLCQVSTCYWLIQLWYQQYMQRFAAATKMRNN